MSMTLQEAELEQSGSSGMSVALIGPNNAHRRVVAKALTGSVANSVREFIDYPGQFTDSLRMVSESFDAVMIDVDSDQSYALALIENITAMGRARVVAYSMRSNPDLEASCLQAGAHDFLPLPSDDDEDSRQTSPAAVEDTEQSGPVDFRMREEHSEAERNIYKDTTYAKADEIPSPLPLNNVRQAAPDAYDFTEWDAKFLRRARPAIAEPADKKPQPVIAPAPSSKSILQLTVEEDFAPAMESLAPVVESQQHEVESTVPAVESLEIVAEDLAPAMESLAPVAESHQPETESLTPEVENFGIEVETLPFLAESLSPVAESYEPEAESLTPEIESLGIVAEYLAPAMESLAPVAESHQPVAESLAPAVESVEIQAEEIAPAAENLSPVPESQLRTFEITPQRIARTPIAIVAAADPLPINKDEPLPARKKAEPIPFSTDDAEESENPSRNWMKWTLVPAGLGLAACFLVIVFGPAVRDFLESALPVQSIAAQVETPDTALKVSHSAPKSWRTIFELGAKNLGGERPAKQVSADIMEAQLTTPPRIPTSAKRPAPQEEPPAGLVPVAFDGGGSVPGAVFGSARTVKVVPAMSAISAGVAEGLLIHRTPPAYPAFAREHHLSGTVTLGATITRAGAIDGVHVLSGPTIFRQAAVDAVNTWRYKPYMLDNQPVEVLTTINVVFQTSGD